MHTSAASFDDSLQTPGKEEEEPALAFPSLSVHDTIASLASDEASMTRIKVPASSSLDDSAYEVLGDSALLHSDDESNDGNTASLTSQSVDGLTPDDLSSLADTDHFHDDQAEDEQFENISRPDEARSNGDLQESVYSSSDDGNEAAHISNDMTTRVSQLLRQADRHIEDSEMTARPGSPDMDMAMTPSLQHLREQAMTESDLYEHHQLPQPRPITWADVRALLERAAHKTQILVEDVSRELAIAIRSTKLTAKYTAVNAQHAWKTAKLTYQANMQNRESLAFFVTVAAQILFGLSLVALVGWISAHLTVTFHGQVRSIDASAPGCTPVIPLSQVSPLVPPDPGVTSVLKAKEPTMQTGLGEPMQQLPERHGPELVASIVGDNHILLAPLLYSSPPRKFPKLEVTVRRNDEELNVTVEQRATVYTVEIEREQAWGVLDVSVDFPKSKLSKPQKFRVNFGNPWLKMSVWTASAEKLSRSLRDEWTVVNGFLFSTMQQAHRELKGFQAHLNTDAKHHDFAAAFAERATAVSKDLSRVMSAQSMALSSHVAKFHNAMSKDLHKGTRKFSEDISRLYAKVCNAGTHDFVRDVRSRHSHLVTRAQTNAANIVKKLQRKLPEVEERLRERFDKRGSCGRKCQRKKVKVPKVKAGGSKKQHGCKRGR